MWRSHKYDMVEVEIHSAMGTKMAALFEEVNSQDLTPNMCHCSELYGTTHKT